MPLASLIHERLTATVAKGREDSELAGFAGGAQCAPAGTTIATPTFLNVPERVRWHSPKLNPFAGTNYVPFVTSTDASNPMGEMKSLRRKR
jgi:hypothetical protein